ncbi:MAG: hypothetical protein GIW98_05985 [Candidatus Eremiobacteraeota bacterium]|nr:hypothetical protein [Candidatus Eremiobacteraeota bacterium]
MGFGDADLTALTTAPGPGARAALGPGLPAVPLSFTAAPAGAALGMDVPRAGAGVALVIGGPVVRCGAGVWAATRTVATLAAGAGVALTGEG